MSGPDRSVEVQAHHRQALERFDYFVTGLTGTLCAFIVQTWRPSRLDWTPQTCETLALLLLCASVVAGFRRIEYANEFYGINANMLHAQEDTGRLAAALGQSEEELGYFGDPIAGQVLSSKAARQRLARHRAESEEWRGALEVSSKRGKKWYRWRNWLLFAGFSLLILAKLLFVYLPASSKAAGKQVDLYQSHPAMIESANKTASFPAAQT